MRTTWIAASFGVVALIAVALLLLVNGRETPAGASVSPKAVLPDDRNHEIHRLSTEVGRLSAEVRRLNQERALPPIVPRPFSAAPESRSVRAAGEVMPLPAKWYLDQYVMSFEGGGGGSEYFRLAVDAYARELVDPIVEIVLDVGRPVVLRRNLVAILGTPRFSGNSVVVDAIVFVIQLGDPRDLALIALKVLPAVGGPGTVAVLERIVWSVSEDLSVAVLRAIAQLAGHDVNAVLLRILSAASRNQIEPLRTLISLLNSADPESALQCFMRASRMSEQPVRLMAANSIADFPEQSFKDYVVEWLGFETDPQVREALQRRASSREPARAGAPAGRSGRPTRSPNPTIRTRGRAPSRMGEWSGWSSATRRPSPPRPSASTR